MTVWIVRNFVFNDEMVGVFTTEDKARKAVHHLVKDLSLDNSKEEDFSVKEVILDKIMESYTG